MISLDKSLEYGGFTVKKPERALDETEEGLLEKVKELCQKEGMRGWKLAQETMLEEEAASPELREAIEYIMHEYQPEYFRPALLSFCCRAVGGRSEATIHSGAALTLFAWAIGIHDDIIDKSKTKNKSPTVFGKFGQDLALILSDVLLFKGFTLFRKTLEYERSIETVIKILATVESIWFEQAAGETLEIHARGLVDVTLDECLRKTRMRASEMEACTRIGGILGSGSEKQIESLGAYGRLIGMMGVLRNELIDMLEFNVLRHRIRRESLPLPIVYALQEKSANPELISLVTSSGLLKEDLKRISKVTDRSGGMKYTATLIKKMSDKAVAYGTMLGSKELELLGATFLIRPREWEPLLSDLP